MSETKIDLEELLPSWTQFYDKFENSEEDCSSGSNCDNNNTALNYLKPKIGQSDKIQKAICIACKMYKASMGPFKEVVWHFFYYWAGDKLSKSSVQKELFGADISSMCGHINNSCGNQQCGIPDEHINQNIFTSRKTLFDFWYDCETAQALLDHSASLDFDKCESYVKDVEAAHKVMQAYCQTNSSNDKYCENFWNSRGNHIKGKLNKLESALTAARERIAQEAKLASLQTDKAIRAATTTSSLSSIIGTLGMTVAPFLLYKVKL
ncbi:KIR protein [Plasmodium coatneyi]|uniref:KIR protein n=1 Tax=Plasmodium coatneyi TaxID=208452 RepID=A0A1B1E627_9APIC|nr:KIR protein [Plasmodium coatneyi]ANQ10484.1 KIR protein [Plasmodium coatneyi]